MSQFPRPRFQTSLPSGPSVGVQAAGIPDPVIAQDPAAQQLQGALGEFAQVAEQAGRMADRSQNDAERRQAKQDVADEKMRRLQEGAFRRTTATTVREQLPGDIQTIKDGKGNADVMQAIKDGKGDPATIVHTIATARMIDVPEEFRADAIEHFESLYSGPFSAALEAKQITDRTNAQKVAFGGLTDNLLLLDDPTKITQTMNEAFASIPNIRPEQLDGIAAHAMFDFAKRGDRKMVDGFKKMLGNREVDQQDIADNMLIAGEARIKKENEARFKTFSAATRMNATINGIPPTITAYDILSHAKDNGIDPNVVEPEVNGLFSDIKQQQEKSRKLAFVQMVDSTKASIASTVATNALSGGMMAEFIPRVLGQDENGKDIHYTVEEQKQDAVASLRSSLGWNGELGPSAGGWDSLTGDTKAAYIKGMGRLKQYDPSLTSQVSSVNLDNDNISTVTKPDIFAVQTLMQVQSLDQTYAHKMVENADSDQADVAELATILAQSKPQDVPGSIMEAKRIYGVVGTGGLKKLGIEESQVISKQDAALANTPQMLKAASIRARMYMYGKLTPEKAYAQAIKDVRETAMEVNGKLVPMGTIYTIDPGLKEATQKATEQLLAGKVKQMIAADERIRDHADDFTIERLDDERYFIKASNMVGFVPPRGIDPVIRTSDIQTKAAQVYATDNPARIKELPSLDELQKQLDTQSTEDQIVSRAKSGEAIPLKTAADRERFKQLLSNDLVTGPSRRADSIKQQMAVRRVIDTYRKEHSQQ